MFNLPKIDQIIDTQDKTYYDRKLFSLDERLKILKKIRTLIIENEAAIIEALHLDLRKPKVEGMISEFIFVLNELDGIIKNLPKWIRPKKMGSPLVSWPAKSYIYREPYGKVLIIGPWNYPFQLIVSPLAGAIAAGNSVVAKPSEIAQHTSKLLARIFSENFDPSIIAIIEGGIEETTYLLKKKFDYIFYTGNGHVGRIVMRAAAENLTPVTLELGGKSPALVLGECDLSTVARRLMWGKFFNAGQTCIAPDYILIEKRHYEAFINYCRIHLKTFYGLEPKNSADFGRIINERHFDRLKNLIVSEQLLIGGECDREDCYIAPTVVSATKDSSIMSDEIFGPILPIITVENSLEAIEYVNSHDKPLAAYIFSKDRSLIKTILKEISAGGMTINDTLVHISNEHIPFGGVGESGMGAYHMHYSFKLFSHSKSVMERGSIDLPMRYPPYKGKYNFLKRLIRWFG